MESIGKIVKFTPKAAKKPKVNTHLHSPAHMLADELSKKFGEPRRFGFYLKMATTYDHNFLRKLMGEILENKNVKTPGRLFAYLIKKKNLENNDKLQISNSK